MTDAVGAVVEVDNYVFVADEADGLLFGVGHGERRGELVGDVVGVEFADAGGGVGVLAALGGAGDHGVEGLFALLPA